MTAQQPSLPEITDEGRPFWEACRRKELVCQRCTACGHYRFPPMPVCPQCGSTESTWARLSGRGTIYSWTVTRVPRFESTPPVAFTGFEDRIPFINAVVELEEQEGLRMLSNIVEAAPETVDTGMPVEVVFHEVTVEVTLPYFRLAA